MSWILFLIVVALGGAFGIVVTLIARRFEFGDPADDASAGIKLTGIYTVFAVVLGFVIFSSWQFYLEASDSIRDEASSSSVINRSARALPAGMGDPVVQALEEYLSVASSQEWEELREGQVSSVGQVALQNLNQAIFDIPAGTDTSIANAQDTMMYYLGAVEQARGDRVFLAEDEDPEFVWALLAVGGLVTVFLSATLHIRSRTTHLQLVGSLSAIIAASLFSVYALGNPFTGPFPVNPIPLEVALQTVAAPTVR
ncbi:MAG: hypothetical protein WA988_10360 [Candidatus Nanopelagicales bacterium]